VHYGVFEAQNMLPMHSRFKHSLCSDGYYVIHKLDISLWTCLTISSIMPPKRLYSKGRSDSVGANPEAKKLLTKLIATGVIPEDAKASDWYYMKPHAAVFNPVSLDKFRPYFRRLLNQKYGNEKSSKSMKFATVLLLIFTNYLQSSRPEIQKKCRHWATKIL